MITLSALFGYNFLVQQAAQSTKRRLTSTCPLDNLEIRLHHTSQHSSLLLSRSTDENKRTQIMSFCCASLFLWTYMYLEKPKPQQNIKLQSLTLIYLCRMLFGGLIVGCVCVCSGGGVGGRILAKKIISQLRFSLNWSPFFARDLGQNVLSDNTTKS